MHELSVAEDMLALIEQEANAQGFQSVQAIWLEVGALSHLEPEALHFCFEAVVKDTLAEGARLHIDVAAAEAQCPACQTTFQIQHYYDPCPECGQFGAPLLSGDQIRIRALDVS